MIKLIFIITLIFNCAFSEEYIKKIGKIPYRDPYKITSCGTFLPYNPKILTIGSNSSDVLALAALREKGRVFCFIHRNKSHGESINYPSNVIVNNLEIINIKHLNAICRELQLSSVEAVIVDLLGTERQILNNLKKLILTARTITVKTDRYTIKEVTNLLQRCNFTLVSYWEKPDGKGCAFFGKTPYYVGIFERRFI